MAIGELSVNLALDTAQFTDGLNKADAQSRKFVESQKRISASIDKQIASLQFQAATIGKTAEQTKLLELANRGANDQQLLQAVNALKVIKAHKDQAAATAASAAATTASANAAAAAAAKQREISAAIDRQVKAYQFQAATVGKSATQIKLLELASQGATQAQLSLASAALRKADAFDLGERIGNKLRLGLVAIAAASVGAAFAYQKFLSVAANIQDVSEKTGASVDSLISLKTAADVAGVSMETVASGMNRLTKGLAGTDEESEGAAAAIKKLGFNLEEFKKLDPGEQYKQLAVRLNEFADGSGKVAAAQAIMGRAGAEQLPVMKEYANNIGRNSVLTTEFVKKADEAADAQKRAASQLVQLASVLATQAAGPITAFITALSDVIKGVVGVDEATGKLSGNNSVTVFAENAARAVGFVIDSFDGLQKTIRVTLLALQAIAEIRLGVTPLHKIGSRVNKLIEEADEILLKPTFGQQLEKRLTEQRAAAAAPPAPPKPPINADDFGKGQKAKLEKWLQEQKSLLDQSLSDIDNYIRREEQIWQSREGAIGRALANNQISIQQAFDARNTAVEEGTAAIVASYQKEIDAIEKFKAKAAKVKDSKAVTDATTKQRDIQAKIDEAYIKRQQEILKNEDDRARAIQDYTDKVDDLNVSLLELQNTEQSLTRAAEIRFERQSRDLQKQAIASGDLGTQEAIARARAVAVGQAQANRVREDAGVIMDNLAMRERNLALERDLGMRGELSTLKALGEARAAAIPALQEQAEKWRKINETVNDPKMAAAIAELDQRIYELSQTTDVLAQSFRNAFQDSFEGAFAAFLDGTKTAKQAFKSFIDDVLRHINRMLANEAASALFGKGGGLDIGGLFGSIFGGGGGGTGAWGGGHGAVTAGGGSNMFSSWLSSLFGGPIGSFASGTNFVPRDGLAFVHRGERITPAFEASMSGGNSGVNQYNTFVLPANVTKSTQNQIASRTLVAAQRAMNRGVAS